MKKNLLILGAREGSIGAYVKWQAEPEWNVHTVGIGDEDSKLDMGYPLHESTDRAIRDTVYDRPWHAVVCTVGVNNEGVLGRESIYRDAPLGHLVDDFYVNVIAPLTWLDWWLKFWTKHADEDYNDAGLHFAVLSSNSAHVPRSTGLPYNATKAALSMAVRCVARDWASRDDRISIYAYEPGWIDGTPMSREVRGRLPEGVAASRAPGGRMILVEDLSRMIVDNLDSHSLNGSTIRVDSGEV